MQKLDELTDWLKLEPKTLVPFAAGEPRRFRIYVNAPANTEIYMKPEADPETGEVFDLRFLAVVTGVDCIDFFSPGGFAITTASDHVWFWSPELEKDFTVVEDPEIYTTIIERQPRNYELELMMLKQRQADEARWALLEGKVNDHLRRKETDDLGTSEDDVVPPQPKPVEQQPPAPANEPGS